jgi:5'-AMP-activated protein kinase catalytic alpha subunit/serine/threonine-protein kinase ULK/ATG1/calcium-dependent protein kinase
MSPEALILNVYSEKTDIWALGVVLYEMTHGRTPFAHCRDDQEIKNCVVRPLPDAAFRNDLPPCFRMLIGKLMEVDEGRRPTVAELIKDPLL